MLDKTLWPWDVKASHLITSSKFEQFEITLGTDEYRLPLTNGHEKFVARQIIRDAIKELNNECMDDTLGKLVMATGNTIAPTPPEYH